MLSLQFIKNQFSKPGRFRFGGSFLLAALLFINAAVCEADTFTTNATAVDWYTGPWQKSNSNSTYPKPGDNVIVALGHTLTVGAAPSGGTYVLPACATLAFTDGNGKANVIVNSTLTVSGKVTLEAPKGGGNSNTIIVNGSLITANLQVGSTSNGSKNAEVVLGATGTLEVSNNLTFGPGSSNQVQIGSGTLALGNSSNLVTILTAPEISFNTTGNYSTIHFNGNNQVIPALTYGNLKISGTGNKALAGNVIVNDIAFGGSASLTIGANQILTINGNVPTTSPISYEGTSKVKFVASHAQDIPAGIFSELEIGGTGDKTLQGNITVDNVTFSGTGRLAVSANTTLTVHKNLPAGSAVTFSPASTIVFDGAAPQTIPVNTYGNLQFTGNGTKNLSGPITAGNTTVAATVNFALGGIGIGANTLTLETSGAITNASASRYVKLTTGKMIVKDLGIGGRTAEFAFPVGTVSSYTPAYIANSGIKNDFSVNVTDGIKDRLNATITNNVVKKTWNVHRETSIGNVNITLRLQWNAGDEATNALDATKTFNRAAGVMVHFENGAWNKVGTSAVQEVAGVYSATGYDIKTFSPFGMEDSSDPLPVELVDFKVSKKDGLALLEWATATEKNNKGFNVQASRDGRTYETVGFVASKSANATTLQQYQFTDQKIKTGLWYFRLQQVDLNGEISYSAAKALDFGMAAEIAQAYPNPFQSELNVKVNLAASSEVVVELRDVTGKLVAVQAQKLAAGVNLVPVAVKAEQPAGIYFLTVKTPLTAITSKLLKN